MKGMPLKLSNFKAAKSIHDDESKDFCESIGITESPQKQTAKTLLDSVLNKSQKMTNPFVIVIGIEDYSDARNKYYKDYHDLNGVSIDVNRMKNLWHNIYNYQNIQVAFAGCKDNGNENGDALSNEVSFNKFLINIRNKQIEMNDSIDGLIFYYSGHGLKNRIILQNGKSLYLKKFIKYLIVKIVLN